MVLEDQVALAAPAALLANLEANPNNLEVNHRNLISLNPNLEALVDQEDLVDREALEVNQVKDTLTRKVSLPVPEYSLPPTIPHIKCRHSQSSLYLTRCLSYLALVHVRATS